MNPGSRAVKPAPPRINAALHQTEHALVHLNFAPKRPNATLLRVNPARQLMNPTPLRMNATLL
ncbi:MAG: hypothetical protein ACHQWU_15350 [Gemmatimonadales bacterium]